MARLFSKGYGLGSVREEQETYETACASCGTPQAMIINGQLERRFCDKACAVEYIAEHAEDIYKEFLGGGE